MPRHASVRIAALALGTLVLPSLVAAATLYVDGQIASASCTTYAPASRSCSGGSARAYKTLSGAASAAVAGDTVYLRAGTYSEQLVPARSGASGQPITYAAYPGEAPRISGVSDPALWIIGRSYIVIDGLTVTNVGGWGRLEDSSYNIIRNNIFTVATIGGTTGGLKLVRSTYNRILDNTIEDGNDNITVQESDRNVFQGNTISTGRHSLLSLRCGNYNVVRGNTFSNPDQKDLEIYDCEGTSDAPVKLDATKRNLVEGNVIADTAASSSDNDYNGIQFAGQQGIVRRNVFRDDMGGAINFQYYSDESLYNNRNRVYHNTFYGNRCYAIVGQSGDSRFYDNRARNNILYKNTNCSGSGGQTSIANSSKVILSDNALATTSPGFVNEGGRDFHLAPGSPMIDAAAFLTTTTAAGSGTQITVADASYFFDGYGIPGELGDEIQLQGQTTVARVVGINLSTNTLTLDRSLSWTSGLGVALRYNGAKPDLGAFEAGAGYAPPSISVSDVAQAEGDSGTSTVAFTVTLSGASAQVVTVGYATASGTASAGVDFLATTGTVVFPAGSTSKAIEVPVVGDRVYESAETFAVVLSGAVNASIADGQGEATILNDDAAGLSIADLTVVEPQSGSRNARFVVTLSPTSGSAVTVQYSTSAGTATPGSDYENKSGTLTFPAGTSTLPVDVVVHADALTEGEETFEVNLANVSGAAIAYGQAIGRIHDPGYFHTLAPCRVMDTRNPAGPYGGPALAAGETRVVPLANACGIPPSAQAVSLNLTVTQPTTAGNLRLYPAGTPLPLVSSINYVAGLTRANNAVAALSPSGALGIRCAQASGTAHVIVDVNGYFE